MCIRDSFEDEDGNKVTTNLEKSEKTVHRVIDKEIYSKKEKGKLTYISERQYRLSLIHI